MKSEIKLFFLFIAAFILHRLFGYLGHYGYDDMEYARVATQFVGGEFDPGNHFSFRLTLVGVAALFYRLFGISDWTSSLPALLFSSGTLFLVYRILKNEKQLVLVAGLALFAFNNWTFFYSDKLMPDVAVTFFIFLFCFVIYSYNYLPRQMPAWAYSFLSALALFLCFNSKETVVLAVPWVIWLIGTDVVLKRPLKFWFQFVAFGVAFLLVYFIVCQLAFGNAFERFHAIVSNSYLNACSYDQQPFAETLKRIAYGLFRLFLTNAMLPGFFIILSGLFFIPGRSLLKLDTPKSFFVTGAFILMLSSNFMSISATSYIPMCLDVRHYLFVVPVVSVAAAMVLQDYFNLMKFRLGLFFLFCMACAITFYLHANIAYLLYLPASVAVGITLFLKPNDTLKWTFTFLLLVSLAIQPIEMMVYAHRVDYQRQKAIVMNELIGKNEKCVVVTDAVQKNLGYYYSGFSKNASCQFISYAEADTFHFSKDGKKYLLNNWYTRYLSGMDDQDLPFYAATATTPVFKDKKLNVYLYELGDEMTSRKLLFRAENDFESPAKYWSKASELSSNQASSGKYSEKLGEFSVCCTIPIDSLLSGTVSQIIVSPKLKILAVSNAECNLVIAIEANGKQYFWKGFELKKYMKSKGAWWQASMNEIVKRTEIQENSVMKIYVWNNEKNEIYIDDLKIEIYSITN